MLPVVGESIVLRNVDLKLNSAMCGKVGHISRVCRKRPQNAPRGRGYTTNVVENRDAEPDTSSQNSEYTLFPIKSDS